jgi:hypothetical protein
MLEGLIRSRQFEASVRGETCALREAFSIRGQWSAIRDTDMKTKGDTTSSGKEGSMTGTHLQSRV